MSQYLAPEPTQSVLAIEGAPHVEGPACRCAKCSARDVATKPTAATADPRQCFLPGIEGVRLGAMWCRDSARPTMPMEQISLWQDKSAKRLGRRWSDRDVAMRQALHDRSWGVVELGQRMLVVPEWMRAEVVDTPHGELVLTRNPRARQILAWAWAAFVAGTFGLRLTRDQWAEVLGCSPRSVHNYMTDLEARGLIRRVKTWQPVEAFGERVRGSWDDVVLVRIGPALDCIALAAFERPQVRFPRNRGVRRHDARQLAQALRCSARDRGRALQHSLAERRARWATARSDERRAASFESGSRGAAPAASHDAVPPSTGDRCMAKSANLPAPSGTVARGTASCDAAGAAPRDPDSKDAALRSSLRDGRAAASSHVDAPPSIGKRSEPSSAAVRATQTRSTSHASATTQRDPSTSRRGATAQGAAQRELTFASLVADAARAFGLSSSTIDELGLPTSDVDRPSSVRERSTLASSSSASSADPATDRRYQAALAALQRTHERDLPLFADDD